MRPHRLWRGEPRFGAQGQRRPNGGGSLTVIDIGTMLNQRFLLEKELGRGGMGAVYSATDEVLQRKVAIKLLKEQSGEEVGKKLRLEAQIAARLLHDHVVRIYDFGQAEATLFLGDGGGCTAPVTSKRWRHLALAERLRILAQVAEALDYAHHQGVVHRDVKPANVLVTTSDMPKLSDFGLSMIGEHGDQTGTDPGHASLHEPRTNARRPAGLSYRPVLAGSDALRVGNRNFAVLRLVGLDHVAALLGDPEPPRSRNRLVSPELEALIVSLMAKRPGGAARFRSDCGRGAERGNRADSRTRRPGADTATRRAAARAQIVATATHADRTAARGDRPAANRAGHREGLALRSADVARPGQMADRSDRALTPPRPRRAARSLSVPAVAIVASTGGVTAMIRSPLARRMLEVVLAEPIFLSAEERYLHGHYLAYLLSGSRRRGLFLRRPLEPRNADRGRLLLGLTYAIMAGGGEDAVREAAALLDQRIEVRSILSPIVVAKYLACRESPAKRKLFRQTRKALGEASTHAQKQMIDAKGMLNPGLMPQRLEDLQLARTASRRR